jgi:RNA polymerase sigma factor (sigma-70 family)
MPHDDAWLIRGLAQGDPEAVRFFCDRYGPMIQQVADRHLVAGLRRRVGPESICQSACLSFLRRVRAGEYRLNDCDDLWKLLCAIALTKVREKVRYHLRHKRSVAREQPLAGPDPADEIGLDPADPRQSPADAVAFQEQFDQVLGEFTEEERELILLRLQNFTTEEIAGRMSCSERTVRRILTRVKDHMEHLFQMQK